VHDNATIRSLAANLFKLLLLTKEDMMREFLVTRIQVQVTHANGT
jgi:hypothetical protein